MVPGPWFYSAGIQASCMQTFIPTTLQLCNVITDDANKPIGTQKPEPSCTHLLRSVSMAPTQPTSNSQFFQSSAWTQSNHSYVLFTSPYIVCERRSSHFTRRRLPPSPTRLGQGGNTQLFRSMLLPFSRAWYVVDRTPPQESPPHWFILPYMQQGPIPITLEWLSYQQFFIAAPTVEVYCSDLVMGINWTAYLLSGKVFLCAFRRWILERKYISHEAESVRICGRFSSWIHSA
jgi:hypothetical protein